jgi:hypothetical protein
VDLAAAEGGVDRARLDVVVAAVLMAVMDDAVDGTADQVLASPAEHPLRRRVEEGRLALGVDAVNALARRVEDHLVAALQMPDSTSKRSSCGQPLR